MFAHPRCYARVLNDCSSKLSLEHYVSRTVLDLLGNEHRITNASWLLPGQQSKPLATSALGSRVLCKKHNHTLSQLDSQALTFFDALLWGFSDRPPQQRHRRVTINADLLELWLLKACCGAFASGNLLQHRRSVPRQIPDSWVKLLFSGAGWQPACGMHIRQATLQPFRGYAIGSVYVEDVCFGGGLEFAGVELFVFPVAAAMNRILEESSGELRPLIYRPGEIHIESRTRAIDINLEWRAWNPTEGVRYQYAEAEPSLARDARDARV